MTNQGRNSLDEYSVFFFFVLFVVDFFFLIFGSVLATTLDGSLPARPDAHVQLAPEGDELGQVPAAHVQRLALGEVGGTQ